MYGKYAALAAAAALLAGCAEIPRDAGSAPEDPWEAANRRVYAFNSTVDAYVVKPVARAYEKAVPEPAREGVTNFFQNLGEPSNAVNNALQGKGERALASVFRLLINTTIGLGGIFDVAGPVGGQAVCREDFGQTLAVWGVPSGPYLVVPFLGPSTMRDFPSLAVEYFSEPMSYVDDPWISWGAWAVDLVNMRANLLPLTDVLEESVEPYAMTRQAFLANRRNEIYDGDPPLELVKDEFEDEDDAPAAEKKENQP